MPYAAPAIAPEAPPLTAGADGVLRIGNTRVTLDTVVGAFLDGESPELIADQYPIISLGQVYATIAYYLAHRRELDAYLLQRRTAAAQVRDDVERNWPPNGLRARLLARRESANS